MAIRKQSGRTRGGGCVGFGRAKRGRPDGGGGQNSQLGGSAEEDIPAVRSKGRTLTPVRDTGSDIVESMAGPAV